MPRPAERSPLQRRTEQRRFLLTPRELAAWKAALEPHESLAHLVRSAVAAEIRRREAVRERQAELERNPIGALDELLGRLPGA
jgi:hypothetical protein